MEKIVKKRISWKLEVKLDEEEHLFKRMDLDYKIIVFICKCGKNKFIIASSYQNINYKCESCNNDIFLNSNEAMRSLQFFLFKYQNVINYLYEDEFIYNIDFEIKYINKNPIAHYYLQIPSRIDFHKEKVFFINKSIYSYILEKNSIKKDYIMNYDDEIFKKLEKHLNNDIKENPKKYNIPSKVSSSQIDIEVAKFFLEFKYFKEYEFYYWEKPQLFHEKNINIEGALSMILNNRNEKSIKRFIYSNYYFQIEQKNYFHVLISIFIKYIKDPNIVIQSLNLEITRIKFSDTDLKNIELLIIFLQIYYKDQQIVKVLRNIMDKVNLSFFIDLLNEFSNSRKYLESKFQKIKCNIINLHDEFTRCSILYNKENVEGKNIFYTEREHKRCKKIIDYEVRLPENGTELIKWGNYLHNCIAGYFDNIKSGTSIIYGFFQQGNLIFVVELTNKKVRDSRTKYNRFLSNEQNNILDLWLRSIQKELEIEEFGIEVPEIL